VSIQQRWIESATGPQELGELDALLWGPAEWQEPDHPTGAAAALAIVAFMAFVMGLAVAAVVLM
jgi:hypothetical protein